MRVLLLIPFAIVTTDSKTTQGFVFKQDNDHCQKARDCNEAKSDIPDFLGKRGIYSSFLLPNTKLLWCLQ